MDRLIYVLFFISAICLDISNQTINHSAEKRSYVLRLRTLYDTLGISEAALLGKVLLPAMIVEKINKVDGSLPKTYVHARDTTVTHLDSVMGDFNVLISTQSLSKGVELLNVSGFADFNSLTVKISIMEHVEPLRSSAFQLSHAAFNNGSKG